MRALRVRRNYDIGDRFRLSSNALDNYGSQYADRVFTVRSWADHYGKPADCCGDNPRDPHGHPGFDEAAGRAIYDSELPFSVYEWEMERA